MIYAIRTIARARGRAVILGQNSNVYIYIENTESAIGKEEDIYTGDIGGGFI